MFSLLLSSRMIQERTSGSVVRHRLKKKKKRQRREREREREREKSECSSSSSFRRAHAASYDGGGRGERTPLDYSEGGGGGKKGVASSFVLVRFAECQRLKEKSGYSSSYPSSSFLQGQYRTVYMPADSSFLQITSVSTKSKYRGCPLLCVGLSLRLFFY